jgi:hypothetical protein
MALPGLTDRGRFFVASIAEPEGAANLPRPATVEEQMNYLLEHPTSMPVDEAAMTYLFADAARLLRLVSTPDDGAVEADDERQVARKSA